MSRTTESAPTVARFNRRQVLPTHPAVLARVIRIAGDPQRPLSELAAVCAQDPGLTVELLRVANSAAHIGNEPVRSVPLAVVKLGARTVRSLAITHTMRTAAAGLPADRFDARAFWEDSLRRAAAAELLASYLQLPDPHEAFAVGLTQDLGALLLAAKNPDAAEHLGRLRTRPGRTRIEAERVLTGENHAEALAASGLFSALPADFRFAVRHHHAPPEGNSPGHRLARLAHAADLLADIVQAFPKRPCIEAADAALTRLGLPMMVPELVDALGSRVVELAQEFELSVHAQPTMEEVQAEAAAALQRLHDEQPPALRTPPPARGSGPRYRRDRLTGLIGARAFIGELQQRCAQSHPLSLIVVDLDHLGRVNSAHGHEVGDAVLRSVARALAGIAGSHGQAARIGGEEFALLLTGCDAASARGVAEQLRLAVRKTPLVVGAHAVSLTVSIGGASVQGPASAAALLRAADQSLRAAKRAGRDRVCWAESADTGAETPEALSGAA